MRYAKPQGCALNAASHNGCYVGRPPACGFVRQAALVLDMGRHATPHPGLVRSRSATALYLPPPASAVCCARASAASRLALPCSQPAPHPPRRGSLQIKSKRSPLGSGCRMKPACNRAGSVSQAWPSRAAALTPLTESAAKKKMLLCQRIAWQNMPLGKNCLKPRGSVFVYCPESRIASRENAFDYDECVSGSIIYTYVEGNPLSLIDPLGLTATGAAIGGTIGSYMGVHSVSNQVLVLYLHR